MSLYNNCGTYREIRKLIGQYPGKMRQSCTGNLSFTVVILLNNYRMAFRVGYRDPCTWVVARLSESTKNHSPAARNFLQFRKSRHNSRAWMTLSSGKPFGIPLLLFYFLYKRRNIKLHIKLHLWQCD